jgi:hypothetical protein
MRNRRTRKRGGMKAKGSSFKNRLDVARKTAEDVKTGTLKPHGKVGLVPIPVARKTITHTNVVKEIPVVEAMPVVEAIAVKSARDNSSNADNFLLGNPRGVKTSGDFIDRINETPMPKPPSKPKATSNRTIKIKPAAPLPITNFNDPKTQEMIANLKSLGISLPANPMPPLPPNTMTFTIFVKAVLEDRLKDITDEQLSPDKRAEFCLTQIDASAIKDENLIANVSGFELTIPWIKLNGCSPILVAATFGLVQPCKQIIEYVSNENQINLLSGCDSFGNNALSLSAQYGYKSLCEYLIGEHKRLGIHLEGYMWPSNVYGDCFGKTPLMHAAECGHLELIKVLLRNGANPLAKNDIHQNALHHCIIKCCPTPSGYKTPFGYILLNTNEWSQYGLAHDDAYKNKELVWRLNRIIHLLLRFMIFENGDYSAGVYRKNGLKTALENDDNGKNKTNVWDDAANNGNGAYTQYTLTNNSNWMAYYYLRRGNNKVFHSLTMQQSEGLSVFVDKYRSQFIQKTGKNKTYSSKTYSPGDYSFKQKLFTNDTDAILPIIKNDPNMFVELEKGFNKDIWEKTSSKDFIHYFLRYLFYEEPIPKESENDKIQKLLSIKRQIYLLKINQHNLKPFVPANRTLKSYKK